MTLKLTQSTISSIHHSQKIIHDPREDHVYWKC